MRSEATEGPGELRLYAELTGTQHLALLGALQSRPTPRREELCQRLELTARDVGRLSFSGGYDHSRVPVEGVGRRLGPGTSCGC